MTVTASAISAILARAGIKRMNRRGTSWSSGFEAETFPDYVRVGYSAANSDQQLQTLKRIAEVLNGRESKKYFARVEPIVPGSEGLVVKVYAYDETDPEQNEERKAMAQEKLAEQAPEVAPSVADIKRALRTYSQYDADFYGSGYKVERLEEDTRLVRIRLVEAKYTTYEGDRDDHIAQTLANYARVVHEAGFEFQVRDDEMSVIVGTAGEWNNGMEADTVSTLLRSYYAQTGEKNGHSGFAVRDYQHKDMGKLRVQYYPDAEHRKDEQHAQWMVERYGLLLTKLGYGATVAYDDTWALLVSPAALKAPEEPQESPEKVRTALLALREAVEHESQFISTRRAGDHSILVMAITLGMEVSYRNGVYMATSSGRNSHNKGTEVRTFPAVNSELLDFIRDELGV